MLTRVGVISSRKVRSLAGFGDVLPDNDGVLRLRKGDSGPEVEDWQTNLQRLGFAIGVTGNMDSPTIAATIQFQGAHGLKETGIVEDATRQAMADDLDKMELPRSSGVNTEAPPPMTFEPVAVSGRFPSWLWLLGLGAVGLAFKKKRK